MDNIEIYVRMVRDKPHTFVSGIEHPEAWLRLFKRHAHCNGTIHSDNNVIELSGDQQNQVHAFLLNQQQEQPEPALQ